MYWNSRFTYRDEPHTKLVSIQKAILDHGMIKGAMSVKEREKEMIERGK